MKLHKLHVGKLRARFVSHRHAVARRHLRVRRVQKNLSRPARSQHHRTRPQLARRAHQGVQITHAATTTLRDNQALYASVRDESYLGLWRARAISARTISRPVESP